MYENKARLLCTAEGTPAELLGNIFTITDAQQMAPRTSSRSRKKDDSDLCVDNELGFAKDRTISRYTYLFFLLIQSWFPLSSHKVCDFITSVCATNEWTNLCVMLCTG